MSLSKEEIQNLRLDYQKDKLLETDIFENPYRQFGKWFEEAVKSEVLEPNAMTLATATPKGVPSARIVLLKSFDEAGFVFYSNYSSKKGQEMAENPNVSLVFFWAELHRQVRIEGLVEKLPRTEAKEYFHSRPRESQLGAWVSDQSAIIDGREVLDEKFEALQAQYDEHDIIPLPDYWGGYIVKPYRIEFWQGRSSRLHDRLRYTLKDLNPKKEWTIERLAP